MKSPFHLVDISPWPILASFSSLSITSRIIIWFHINLITPLYLSLIFITIIASIWWRDIIRERTITGHHTKTIISGLKLRIILFIASEVIFFFAFFWAFFHRRLSPTTEIGLIWPPSITTHLNPFSIPILNTIILLSSGISVTWAHNSIIQRKNNSSIKALLITVSLGAYFSLLQLNEYKETSFSIADRVFGSTFFLATGFHGLHVIIGSIFLSTALIRLYSLHISKHHHIRFELAAWYWHFVDVVWIFLYFFIYWWAFL